MILILYNVIIIKGDNRRKKYSKNFTEYLSYIYTLTQENKYFH